MPDASTDVAQEKRHEEYEPPAIVALGSLSTVTAVVGDTSVTLDESDRLLKLEIEPVSHALERLGGIRTS